MSNYSPQQITNFTEDVLATFAVCIESKDPSVDPFNIDWHSNCRTFFNNNIELFGTVLIDLHILFNATVDYKPYSEFDMFETLEDAYIYVCNRILTDNGLDDIIIEKS